MRNTRRIIPYALLSGLLVSCVTDHKLARVRISQPQMKEAVTDTGFRLPRQIAWTDDKGKEHIVTEATKDSVTGEYITQMELSESPSWQRANRWRKGTARSTWISSSQYPVS